MRCPEGPKWSKGPGCPRVPRKGPLVPWGTQGVFFGSLCTQSIVFCCSLVTQGPFFGTLGLQGPFFGTLGSLLLFPGVPRALFFDTLC
jgi:hypothetical protein